jgi:hypothetical protein
VFVIEGEDVQTSGDELTHAVAAAEVAADLMPHKAAV